MVVGVGVGTTINVGDASFAGTGAGGDAIMLLVEGSRNGTPSFSCSFPANLAMQSLIFFDVRFFDPVLDVGDSGESGLDAPDDRGSDGDSTNSGGDSADPIEPRSGD